MALTRVACWFILVELVGDRWRSLLRQPVASRAHVCVLSGGVWQAVLTAALALEHRRPGVAVTCSRHLDHLHFGQSEAACGHSHAAVTARRLN